ncbi:hypothetical protein KTH87_13645 [Acinetobacter baumannii]|uniref:hypothetical protein n=2 Tax=Acinetobacter baumannii TaxID=470 RepID=UPI00044FEB0A|nr:hypothetical protein [Acinetobacter baumannii]EXB50169.1 putative membrane protein [Acinetobacter baumannii 1440422]EKU8788384.1 hypothetical protein [Acinetobacter baumannii]EKV0035382.1 hypothetical protein [Acinetobacter baumannii]EKV5300948.1 hypothetical protein [Acinetobacter baumannii]EKW8830434.1 hypothetical protein [Acinetobacter baumannii]
MIYNFSYPLKLVMVGILFSIYLLNLKLTFIPLPLVAFLSIFGFIFCLIKNKILVPRKYYNYFVLISLLSMICAFSFLVNQKSDFYFFIEICVYSVVFFFAALFLKSFVKYIGFNYNYETLTKVSVIAVVVQLFFSILAYINAVFFNIIFSIVDINLPLDTLDSFNQGRLVGIGASFFASGILNSFFLILLAGLLVSNRSSPLKSMKYIFLALLLSFMGVMASRTTVIGIMLFILISLCKKPLYVFYSTIPLLFILIFVNWFSSDSRLSELLKFGTDFLFDYENSQASESTGTLFEMLSIIPTTLKTWIIGDGLYHNDLGGYYMSTDVGYTRILFATGLVGFFFYTLAHLYLIFTTFWREKKFVCISLVILFFLLHIKGVANLMPLLFLYFIVDQE